MSPKSVSRYLLNVDASHITEAALARATDKPVLVLLSGYGELDIYFCYVCCMYLRHAISHGKQHADIFSAHVCGWCMS